MSEQPEQDGPPADYGQSPAPEQQPENAPAPAPEPATEPATEPAQQPVKEDPESNGEQPPAKIEAQDDQPPAGYGVQEGPPESNTTPPADGQGMQPPEQGYPSGPPADAYGVQKRARDENPYASNKRPAMPSAPGFSPETVFRFLCDANKVGAIIGQGGATINQIQHNSGAHITCIQDAPAGCDERIFVISSDVYRRPGEQFNGAQQAIFELFDRQLEIDSSQPVPGGPFLRMLICASQAGSLIGKSGVTIKELKDRSGCQNIKVLQPEDLPPCGLASDKLVHITGSPDSLRTVLRLATDRLRDSPPKEMPSHEPCQNAFMAMRGPPMGAPVGGSRGPPGYPPHGGMPGVGPPMGGPPFRGPGGPAPVYGGPPGRM